MRIVLVLFLIPFYLFGYECVNGEESIKVNNIVIPNTDERYGYKDLDCESIYVVYGNYAKNKASKQYDLNDSDGMIISTIGLFDLKKESNVTTLLVDIEKFKSIPKEYKLNKDVYQDDITKKVYYPLSFNNAGEYIVNEKRKTVEIKNDLDMKVDLNTLFKNTKWFKNDKKNIEPNDSFTVTLLDKIDISQKDDLKRYIKVEQKKNIIVLSKHDLKYKFLPPKIKTIDEDMIPTELIFDRKEYQYNEENKISSIDEFKKFNNLGDHKEGHLTGISTKLTIDEIKFKDNLYIVSIKYSEVYKNKLHINAGKYQKDFDQKNMSINYKGLTKDIRNITHIDKKLKMELVLADETPFTFNKDNKNKQIRTSEVTFVKDKEQKINIYPTYEYKTIKFVCEMQEFDTNGGKFREKKKTGKDTRSKLTLDDNTTITCGESKKIKFDKKDNINDFIAKTKGFGNCKFDGQNALCLDNRLKLFIAYVPYSHSQFIVNTKDSEISMKKIERFLKKIKQKNKQKLYVKNTDNPAYQFSEYFDESYKDSKNYNDVDIRNNVDTLFDVEGDINILYFSKLTKPELKHHFCKSKFNNKVVVFNFYEDMGDFTCGENKHRLKIIDIADNLPISDSDLEKKLNDSIDEIQKFIEGK